MKLTDRRTLLLVNAYNKILRTYKINEVADSECICTFLPRSNCTFTCIINAMTIGLYAKAIEMDSTLSLLRLTYMMIGLNLRMNRAISTYSSLYNILARAIRSCTRKLLACLINLNDSLSNTLDDDR